MTKRRAESRVLHNCLGEVRKRQGLTRAELAERVGVNPQTVGALERGQYYPSLYVAMLIADECKTPLEEIFAWDPARLGTRQETP